MSESNCPAQIVEGPVIEIAGSGFTVTVTEALSEHELLVTTTEYVEEEVGVTTIDVVVAPLLQEKEEPPETLSVVLSPMQIFVLPLMLAVIPEVTVTVATALAVQIPFVTVTVYEVVVVGEA